MVFSEQELICFNSVLDGRPIYGTKFSIPEELNQQYYEDTMQQLKNHGMLSGDNKVNELFALVVNTLKEYKNSKTYLKINGAYFALTKSLNNVVFLAKVDGGYELSAFDKVQFLYELIKSNTFLAGEDTENFRIRKALGLLEWQQTLEEAKPEDLIYVYKCENNKIKDVLFLYHCGARGFIYNAKAEEITQCGSLAIRKKLFALFNIHMNELLN